MATETIESLAERISRLEQRLAELTTAAPTDRPGVIGRTRFDFLERNVGIFANNPAFDEMTRKLEEERERERAEARALDGSVEPTP